MGASNLTSIRHRYHSIHEITSGNDSKVVIHMINLFD